MKLEKIISFQLGFLGLLIIILSLYVKQIPFICFILGLCSVILNLLMHFQIEINSNEEDD